MRKFGQDNAAPPAGIKLGDTTFYERRRIRAALTRRLREKMANYDREATRLRMRGEVDSARVLERAAGQLRAITLEAETAPLTDASDAAAVAF